MSVTNTPGQLLSLSETDRMIADPAADVRGRKVFDSNGDEIGTVDDLLVDDEEDKVRLLRIGSGGFLGLGKDHILVPVDAVERVEKDRVHISRDRARMSDVPAYDPEVTRDDAYYANLYGWWGYSPYWTPGYVEPPYPRYR